MQAGRSGADRFAGKVALVTGAAQGIGEGVARALAAGGAQVVLADVNPAAEAVAADIGGVFVPTDVRDPEANRAAVAAAGEHFGGLDIVHLNAGISTGCGLGDDFDLDKYRRAMGVNLDGVVFGVAAALPALRARGGGDIVATASLAGLAAVPFDPIYGANKHAVVGLVRALGPVHAPEGIRVNAVCPGFADTAIVGDIREFLAADGIPLLTVATVVDVVLEILTSGEHGQCWYIQPGRTSEPFRFRNVPGPRAGSGPAPAPDTLASVHPGTAGTAGQA